MIRSSARALTAVAALCLLLAAPQAEAQAPYPGKPIQFIVTVSAGGSIDTIARAIAEELAKSLSQPVVVENRPSPSRRAWRDSHIRHRRIPRSA